MQKKSKEVRSSTGVGLPNSQNAIEGLDLEFEVLRAAEVNLAESLKREDD